MGGTRLAARKRGPSVDAKAGASVRRDGPGGKSGSGGGEVPLDDKGEGLVEVVRGGGGRRGGGGAFGGPLDDEGVGGGPLGGGDRMEVDRRSDEGPCRSDGDEPGGGGDDRLQGVGAGPSGGGRGGAADVDALVGMEEWPRGNEGSVLRNDDDVEDEEQPQNDGGGGGSGSGVEFPAGMTRAGAKVRPRGGQRAVAVGSDAAARYLLVARPAGANRDGPANHPLVQVSITLHHLRKQPHGQPHSQPQRQPQRQPPEHQYPASPAEADT